MLIDDNVSRQAVNDAVENTIAKYIPTLIGHYEKIPLELAMAIKNVPSSTPTQKWVPVSERLPEEMGLYLVTLDYKDNRKGVTTLWYYGKTFGWDFRVADTVIAWQPLPKPYE